MLLLPSPVCAVSGIGSDGSLTFPSAEESIRIGEKLDQKKQYNREDLLKLMVHPLSQKRPDQLPDLPSIVRPKGGDRGAQSDQARAFAAIKSRSMGPMTGMPDYSGGFKPLPNKVRTGDVPESLGSGRACNCGRQEGGKGGRNFVLRGICRFVYQSVLMPVGWSVHSCMFLLENPFGVLGVRQVFVVPEGLGFHNACHVFGKPWFCPPSN